MKNYVGTQWSELNDEDKKMLLSKASCINGITGNEITENGEGIVDLLENLSVAGWVENGEIKIKGSETLYDPIIGCITPQARYDQANTTQKKLKLNYKTDKDIIDKLGSVGNMQGYIKRLIRADIASNDE